jgi:hypothetical protein
VSNRSEQSEASVCMHCARMSGSFHTQRRSLRSAGSLRGPPPAPPPRSLPCGNRAHAHCHTTSALTLASRALCWSGRCREQQVRAACVRRKRKSARFSPGCKQTEGRPGVRVWRPPEVAGNTNKPVSRCCWACLLPSPLRSLAFPTTDPSFPRARSHTLARPLNLSCPGSPRLHNRSAAPRRRPPAP